MNIFKISLASGLLLLALGPGNGLYAASGHEAIRNVYNWSFFVLMAFFGFCSLFVPVIYSDAVDESSDWEVPKIFVSFFFSAFVTVLILMIVDGVRYLLIFGLPSPVVPVIMLLFTMVLFLSGEFQVSGNALIDTFFFSIGLLLVSFLFTLGLKVNCLLGFPHFSTKVFFIMFAVLFLIFRIILWAKKA